jgi:hypothetical protein
VKGLAPELPPLVAQHLANLECSVTRVTPTNGDTTLLFDSITFAPKERTGGCRAMPAEGLGRLWTALPAAP